jgi:hypothetical protein
MEEKLGDYEKVKVEDKVLIIWIATHTHSYTHTDKRWVLERNFRIIQKRDKKRQMMFFNEDNEEEGWGIMQGNKRNTWQSFKGFLRHNHYEEKKD